jgi:FMN phosphatase YigB (HAD superfamily)
VTERFILFDVGNVIIDWNPVRLYRKIFGTQAEAEVFCRDICNMAWHVEHDRGRTFASNARRLKADYPQYADEIDAWRERWFEMFNGYVAGMPPLIARLEEAGYPLYGLSNMSHEVWPETCDRYPMLRVLRDVVVSGKVKLIKPDPEIYAAAHALMGHPDRDRVLFIDDSLKNVQAARRYGFMAHHFTSVEVLQADLISQGFLLPAA